MFYLDLGQHIHDYFITITTSARNNAEGLALLKALKLNEQAYMANIWIDRTLMPSIPDW